jgi:hypothetical protein
MLSVWLFPIFGRRYKKDSKRVIAPRTDLDDQGHPAKTFHRNRGWEGKLRPALTGKQPWQAPTGVQLNPPLERSTLVRFTRQFLFHKTREKKGNLGEKNQ